MTRLSQRLTLGLAIVTFLSGCASTRLTPVSSPITSVGKDGQLSRYDELDFWQRGTPPRPYRVVGTIEDRRRGVYGDPTPDTQSDIFDALAKNAHRVRADGVIILSQTHPTEESTTYVYKGMSKPQPYFEKGPNGKKSLVTPDPIAIVIPDGLEQVETDELQTQAEAIDYVSSTP